MYTNDSATYRVLAVGELLEQIMKANRDAGTLIALVRTCKLTHAPAARILWRQLLSLQPLLGLFPADAIDVDKEGQTIVRLTRVFTQ